MSYYDPQLVQQIQEQSTSQGEEEALLLGAWYETGIGTNPASYSQQGVPDPTEASPSFGPYMWHYNVGALNDLMDQQGWTEQQAIDYVTTPAGAVSAAIQRYSSVAQAQGIDPNSSPEAAMQLATAAEVGVGEQNALSSGDWQSIYDQYIQPLVGTPGNTPLTGQPAPAQPSATTTAVKTGTKATTGMDPVTAVLVALDSAMNPPIVKAGLLGTIENLLLPTKWEGDVRDFIEMNLSRLGFAAGFLVLGIAGTFRLISGGRVSGKDIPGLAAGFLAGPEAGIANALGKVVGGSVRRPDREGAERRERSEARADERLSFARSREERASAFAPEREERAQEAALRAVSREGRAQRSEVRQEGAAQRAEQRESRLGEGLQLRREALQQRGETETARLGQAGERLTESRRARIERGRQQSATRFLRANQFSQRETRLGRSLNLREQFEPERVQQSGRRVELSQERNDLRRWGLEMQAARQNFMDGIQDFVMERDND